MDRRRLVTLGLFVLLTLDALSLAWGSYQAIRKSDDLRLRVFEVAAFVRGEDPYTRPDMTYPPAAPLVLSPLIAPFQPLALRIFWLALNLAALCAVCRSVLVLWGEDWPGTLQIAVVLTIIAAKPTRLGIGMGQFHLIPTLLVLLAIEAVRSKREIVAGLLLGIALVKPTMVIPFLIYFALKGLWKTIGTAVLTQLIATLTVALRLGISPVRLMSEWMRNARLQTSAGVIDVASLVARIAPDLHASPFAFSAIVLFVGIVICIRYRNRSDLGVIAVCSFISCAFTYHRWYDLILLTPCFVYAIDAARRSVGARSGAIAAFAFVFAAIWVLPNNAWDGTIAGRIHEWTLVASCYLLFTLLIFVLEREPAAGNRTLKLAVEADRAGERPTPSRRDHSPAIKSEDAVVSVQS